MSRRTVDELLADARRTLNRLDPSGALDAVRSAGKMRMLNFPQLEPDSACMSLVRRGVTALITDGCARKPRDDARSH